MGVLEGKVDDALAALGRIEELLEGVGEDCNEMSGHIEFVNRVYDTVRHPLNYITQRLGSHQSLPRIAD